MADYNRAVEVCGRYGSTILSSCRGDMKETLQIIENSIRSTNANRGTRGGNSGGRTIIFPIDSPRTITPDIIRRVQTAAMQAENAITTGPTNRRMHGDILVRFATAPGASLVENIAEILGAESGQTWSSKI